MKLLFTQDALNSGGAERSHLEILSRFSSEMDVTMVYFYPKHDLKQAYEKAGIRLIFLDIPESYNFILAAHRLVRLIRHEKPDLLISCLWRADQITRIASFITGVPVVGTLVNDSYSPLAWNVKKGWKHKGVYWLDRMTSGIPIHWIANAQALADTHVKTLGLDAKKISVVYRGREIPLFASKQEKEIFHQPSMLSQNPDKNISYNFLSYGRLLERKGFQDAIQAFAQLVKSYPECTLTIYGEGPYRTKLENLIRKLGLNDKVTLPGQVSDPTELLNTAHCFIFPSWYEGFSGALVEAMMAGIPIIASDISMNLEAVTHQQTALIYRVNKPEMLAEQMRFALNNPAPMAKLGQEARKVAIEKFSIDKIAREYEATLHAIFESTLQHKTAKR